VVKLQKYPLEQQADSPQISWSITIFSDFKQTASVSSFFPSLSVGFCVVDCKKRQVWSQLSVMSSMQGDPRKV